MIKVAIEDLEKNIPFIVKHIEAGDSLLICCVALGIIVKYRLGKLLLPLSPEKYLPLQRERHNILSLSLDEAEIIHLSDLPSFHRDPFDRMLICQAIENNMTIVTMDSAIAQYPIKILPKS
jgi:PIN domain nuclease of toxin-antitoxin system